MIKAIAVLGVSELGEVFASLNLSDAVLTCHSGETGTYSAGIAIRAESYIEELKGYTWEEFSVPAEWNESVDYYCQLAGPGVTLTAFQDSDDRPLHVVTDDREGWFTLPYIEDEQAGYMICETFEHWYAESKAATLYGGAGTPLTAEELSWFQDYTAFERTYYDEERSCWCGEVTPVSCFFTS